MNRFPQKRKETASSTLTPTLLGIVICSGAFTLAAFAAAPSWWSTGPEPAVMAEQVTTNDGVVTTNYVPNPTGVVTQGQLKQFTVRAVDELNAALPGGAGTNLNTMASNWAQDYLTNGWSATNIKPSDYTVMTQGQLKTIAHRVYGRISAAGYTNFVPSWLPQNTNSDGNVAVLGQLKEAFNFDFSLSGTTNLTATPGAGAVTLNWSSSTNSAIHWIVEQQNLDGSWGFVTTLPNTAASYTITGLTNSVTYNFQVFANGTNNVSQIASVSGVPSLLTPAALPTVTPSEGAYTSTQTVTLSSTSPGAIIYYTTDGSTPTTSSASMASGGTIVVSASETLNAMAAASGYAHSSILGATYFIIPSSGLVSWLRADAGVTTNSSGYVSAWEDQSLNTNNGVQATSGIRPTLVNRSLNNSPVIRFNGTNQYLAIPACISNDFSMVVVFRSSMGSGEVGSDWYQAGGVVDAETPFTVNDFGMSLDPAGHVLTGIGNPDTTQSSIAGGYNNGHAHETMFLRTKSSGSFTQYVDSVLQGSRVGGTNTLNAPPRITIGATQTLANYYGGDVAEVLLYTQVLSAAQQQQLSAYLAAKYGLPLSLPAPTMTPDGGIFTSSTTVSFSVAPTPAVVRYTTDGTTPTLNSPQYSSSLILAQSCPVQAAIFLGNVQVSPVAIAQFYVGDSGNIGISDAWQMEYFGHTGLDPNAQSPGGSGLTNLQAYLYGYNPNMYSTNGDGLSDLVNFGLGYSGTDTDINGYKDADGNPITNSEQLAMGLDPFDVGINPPTPTPPTADPSDHTAPVITLSTPTGATLLP